MNAQMNTQNAALRPTTSTFRDPFLNELNRGSCALASLLKAIQTAEPFLERSAVTAMYAAVSEASGKQQRDLDIYHEHLQDARLESMPCDDDEEEEYDA